MDKEQYQEAKIRLEEVTRMLKHEEMSPNERNRLEREGKELARVVMSPCLPFGWGYRIVMIAITAIGFWGIIQGKYSLILFWLLLPLFSPRIVGECLSKITGFQEWE